MDIVQTRHWFERCVGKEPSHSSSDSHEIVAVHLVQKFRVNVLTQWQVWKPFSPSGRTCRSIKQSGVTPQRALNSKHRKAQVLLPRTHQKQELFAQGPETKGSFKGIARDLCAETRRDNEKEGSTGQLLLMPGALRPGACVWLSRAGLTRADP